MKNLSHFILSFLLIVCLCSFEESKQKIYNIANYGAVGDGVIINTQTIQQIIDQCAEEGGGTIVVPKGIFKSGALFFKQGVNLHLEKGGVLKGTVNTDDYPVVDTRWEGIEQPWRSAFINVFGLNGFKLTGKGTIDGSGEEWAKIEWSSLMFGRPRLIAVQNSKNVSISDISVKNQACWGVFILYSHNVNIRDLTIRAAHYIPMSDGIDIDSSIRVHISDCDIDVNDDCIAVKSGKDEDGRRVGKPSENILIENCHFRYGHGGVSIGSEMSGGIRNVEVRHCTMEADNWAPVRFKSQPGRGGIVENIVYHDLTLKNTRQAFEFNMEWRMVPPIKPPSDPLPVIRNIKIINVSGTVEKVGIMHGLPDSPIQNVSFQNCHIKAKRGFVLENVENIDLSGLHITVEEGEPIVIRNTALRTNVFHKESLSSVSNPTAGEVATRFKNPPPQYSLSFYWGWDGKVTEEVIARDLDEFRSNNVSVVTIEPGYDMDSPYLSKGWFEKAETAVRLAKERNMCVYLVDEGKYPSGFAGGKISEEVPEFTMKALIVAEKINISKGESLSRDLSPEILSAAAYNKVDSTTHILDIGNGRLNWTAPAGDWEILLVKSDFRSSSTRSVNNPERSKNTRHALIDYLDSAATRKFIEFTHEKYAERMQHEFGKTILGFRGDEPDYSIRGIPWTTTLFETFERVKGYDVRPYAAFFFAPALTEEQWRVRADYWDVWSTLFAENFFKIQADWCANHHLDYLVHLNHEDKMVDLIRSTGDFFKAMRYVQMPGVDAIWDQIWPEDNMPVYPKYASSAAHLFGRPRSFTESFAAYRPQPNIDQAKWIIDYQLVRGINMVEAMFVPASTSGKSGMRGWLADEKFSAVAKYVQRACYLLSQGTPAAKIAVYFPTTSIWLGNNGAEESALTLMQKLLDMQLDFDVVDEQSLQSSMKLENGRFINLSGQLYSTVIVPPVSVISKKALSRLKEFKKEGGEVIFLGDQPKLVVDWTFRDAKGPADITWAVHEPLSDLTDAVLGALPPADFHLAHPAPSIKYTHRKWNDADLYFVFNESNQMQDLTITLSGKGKVQLWDAMTGEIQDIADVVTIQEGIRINLQLEPWSTRFFVIDNNDVL